MNQNIYLFWCVTICRQNSPTNFGGWLPGPCNEASKLQPLKMDGTRRWFSSKSLILSGKLLVLRRVCCHPFKDGKAPPKFHLKNDDWKAIPFFSRWSLLTTTSWRRVQLATSTNNWHERVLSGIPGVSLVKRTRLPCSMLHISTFDPKESEENNSMAVSLLNAGFPSSTLILMHFDCQNQPFEISFLGDSFKENVVP